MSSPEDPAVRDDGTRDRGDARSISLLVPLVYNELRALAASYMDRQSGHTLQPTALVHEAFVKLAKGDRRWSGREHFMAVAAKAMRQVLVDHSRRKGADKRGGGLGTARITLTGIAEHDHAEECRVSDLDILLTELAASDERAAQVAEMRLFGGMEQAEIAGVLGVSRSTVSNDWRFARAWLAGRLKDARDG